MNDKVRLKIENYHFDKNKINFGKSSKKIKLMISE